MVHLDLGSWREDKNLGERTKSWREEGSFGPLAFWTFGVLGIWLRRDRKTADLWMMAEDTEATAPVEAEPAASEVKSEGGSVYVSNLTRYPASLRCWPLADLEAGM